MRRYYGGVIYARSSGTCDIDVADSSFLSNSASSNGGAIDMYAAGGTTEVQINCSTFESGYAIYGGAISARGSGLEGTTLTVRDSHFESNVG